MNSFRIKGAFIIAICLFFCQNIYSQGDICSSATTLTPGTTCTYTTVDNFGFTVQDLNNGTCTGNLNDDVYFQFTATEPTMTVNVDGSGSFDAVLGVFGGTCAALVQEGPCIDNTGNGGIETQTFYGLTVGQTYYILVYDWGSDIPATTTFDICVYETCPGGVPNDLCVNATGLTLGVVESTNNICASPNTDDPDPADICATTIENTVWYEFTPTDTDQYTATISNFSCLYTIGLQMAVVSGSCGGPYTPVDCDAGITDAQFIFTGTAGTTYYIVIDGIDGDQCDFDILIEDACAADAGTNTSAASIVSCFNEDVSVSTVGSVNTSLGADPCIGWGFWVADDPLGLFVGLSDIGSPPSGGMPTDDNNYVGAYPSGTFPNANGPNATLPAENNGVTYFVAPITMSDCSTAEINAGCYDVGDYTEVYFNPEISYSSVIECDDSGAPTTQITFTFSGGNALVDGTNFTITNNGDGTPDLTTVADGGQVIVSGIPNGGNVDLTITDAVGCSIEVTVGPIDAAAYCPLCGADAGTVLVTQTGSGVTTVNNGVDASPFILCFNDQIALDTQLDYTLPPPGGPPWTTPGLIYIIYTCPPSSPDPNTDPCYTGVAWTGENLLETNDGSLLNILETSFGVISTDNELWFVPTVIDDVNGWDLDNNGDGCFDQGFPIQVTFLEEITANAIVGCGGTVQMTVFGGSPDFYPDSYTIINNGSGTLVDHIGLASGGGFSITGLSFGDIYDITISDPNGCSVNYSGTYDYVVPVPTLESLQTDFCLNDPVDNFEVFIDGSPALSGLGGSSCTTPTVTATGDDYLNVTANIDLSCAAGYPFVSATLDFTTIATCTGWSYFEIVVNGVTVATNLCDAAGFDLTPFFPLNSVQVVSQDNDGWIDPVTITAFVQLQYTNTNSVSVSGTGVTDNGDGTGIFTPNIIGTHTVTGTIIIAGCTYDVTQDVTVHPYPVLAPLSTVSVCDGASLDLDANLPTETSGVAGTGQWYTGTDNTGTPVSGTVTVNNGDQFYYEYISTLGGCVVGTVLDVIVDTAPVVAGSLLNGNVEGCGIADAPSPATNVLDLESLGDPGDPLLVNDDVTIDADLIVTYSDLVNGSCPTIITRTYTITDECGNSVDVVQTITIDDTTLPTASNPSAINVECIGDVPANDITSVTDEADNCTATPLVAFVSDVSDGNNCPEVITRTYSVTDDCGNSINVTQTITVDDVTPPTASNPPTLNITTGPAPAPDVTAITDEADNCTLIPIVAFVSDSSDNNSCPETIYREYSITDDCGNQTFVTQLIIIGGGIVPSPVLTVNGPICEGDDATFTITGQADAVVTYDVGSGVQTTTLTGGISTIIITSSNTNLVMTLTNISDGSCSTVLNIVDSVVVNPVITPTFIQLGPYCVTGNVDVLPLVSNEGVTGTWSPDPIDNSLAGTFTTVFTPTLSQCTNTAQMDITITPAPFIEAAATDSLICEGDSIVLYISDISAGMLVDTFTMTFGSAFSYTTNNTVLPGPYVVVVNGTFTGATGEIRDAHYLFQQGGVPITPIAGSPWQWNGTNVSSQSVLPWSYNPIHEYNFFFNGGGSQTFSFTDSNYGDNSGSLTFEIYYLGNISWSTGSTDFTDTIYPPVGSNTYSVTVDYGSGCVATDDVTITVDPGTPATFAQLGPYCVTGNVDALPLVSNEGYTGTWSPNPIDNSSAGTFTTVFTPDPGQCAANDTMDITITPAPFIEAAATDSLICEGDSTVLYISDISAGMLVDTFTMTFGSAFSYTTNNTVLPGPYVVVVNGTFTGATGEIRDAHYLFQQGGVPITPIAGSPWQWNGTNVSSQSVLPWSYNPIHEYNFFFNGGGSQTFSFTDSNYGDNSGSLTFEIYYLGNISWSTGSTDFTDTIYPPVGSNTYSVTVDYGSGCVATDDVIITVDPIITPTFTQLGPYCENNTSVVFLPSISNEGITGSWTPPIVDMAAVGQTTHLFSCDTLQCSTDATMDITIDPAIQSTFTQLGSYCVGDTPDLLLGTSLEGITGSWSPTTISTAVAGTSTYTFTFDAGQCALGTTMDVEIIAPTIPAFTQIASICINSAASSLPGTSDNGVSGTWLPATINTATAGISTYTFTPDAGLCATTTTMDITIDPAIQSTFTQLGSYCVGDIPDVLLGASIEGINGTWLPVTINTATPGMSTYTFTIDAGQCALGTTMDVDITDPTSPTFTQIAPICINAVAAALPSISNNGVSGTWLPATINTAAAGISTYTFTPDVGLCATVTTMDITIDPAVQSTFTQLGTYCEGDTPGALLGTSIEGITGSWSPTTISTAVVGTSAYAFTFDAGQCALGTTMDVEIIAPTIPTFTQIAPVCINGSASAFSTTSDNGITGTWSPAIINTAVAGTSTYTFTPDAGICATTTTMDITIDPAIQSTFTQLGTYCVGDTPGALLNTSLEGLTGTWSPVTINTAIPGTSTYTFTMDAGQCALGTTMDVDITAPTTPTFTQIAPICINAVAAALPSISNNGVSGTWLPATINTTVAGTITYTFTPDVGLCATVTTMDVDIIALPFVDAGTDQVITCITNVGGAQVGSAPVAGNTYNWTPSGGLTTDDISNPIANPVGNTTYTVTVTDVFGCVSIGQVNVSLDNSPPTIGITNNTGSTELTCTLIDINLTATGGDTYSWDNGLGNTSNVTVNSPGTYVVIGTGINGCESSSQIVISEDIDVDLIAILINDEICSGEDALINVTSSNATSFDWTVVQNTATGASAGTGLNTPAGLDIIQTLTTTGPGPGTIDYIISPVLGACTGSSQTITVNIIPPVNPVFAALGPYCLDETIGDNLNPISDNNITGVWSPSTISTSTEGTTTYSFVPQLGECAIATTMDIVVNALPTVSFSADNIEGCSPLNVNLTGGSLTGNNIWTLGNGDVLNGISVNTSFLFPGCYDVTLFVEENGCSNTLTLDDYICVQSDPLASFTVSPQSFTDVNQLVSFTNNSQGAVDYIWSFGDGYTGQTFNPSHLYYETEAGIMITLTAISDFGCIDSTQVFIPFDEQEIFYVPNTFTPDGDNFNQTFTPIFYSGFDPYNFEMLIFNRWGEVIFETRDCTKGWDGSYGLSGSDSQDGVYTWKIIYKNPETDERKIVVGHVTLLR